MPSLPTTNVEKHDVSLADIYKAVNRIFGTYATYYRLVTNKTWMGRYPAPQFDWLEGFTYPWWTKDFNPFEPPD